MTNKSTTALGVSAIIMGLATQPASAAGLIGNVLGGLTGSNNTSTSSSAGSNTAGLLQPVTSTVSGLTNITGNVNDNGANGSAGGLNSITTQAGKITTLDIFGDGLAEVAVDRNSAKAVSGVTEGSALKIGDVASNNSASDNALNHVINMRGIEQAQHATVRNGVIVLSNDKQDAIGAQADADILNQTKVIGNDSSLTGKVASATQAAAAVQHDKENGSLNVGLHAGNNTHVGAETSDD